MDRRCPVHGPADKQSQPYYTVTFGKKFKGSRYSLLQSRQIMIHASLFGPPRGFQTFLWHIMESNRELHPEHHISFKVHKDRVVVRAFKWQMIVLLRELHYAELRMTGVPRKLTAWEAAAILEDDLREIFLDSDMLLN